MEGLERYARGDQLGSERRVKVDRKRPGVRPGHVARRRSAGRLKGGDDILPDLVAAPENRRPHGDDEVTGGDPTGSESSHGVRPDSICDPSPTCVDRRHDRRTAVHEQDGNAVGGPNDRNGTARSVSSGTNRSIGLRRALRTQIGVHDDSAVHLLQERRSRRSQSGRAQEGGTARPRGEDLILDRTEIEVRATEGEPRAERMGHTANRVEGAAAHECYAVDLLEAPTGIAHGPVYFADERSLMVALISPASFARGSSSTYF